MKQPNVRNTGLKRALKLASLHNLASIVSFCKSRTESLSLREKTGWGQIVCANGESVWVKGLEENLWSLSVQPCKTSMWKPRAHEIEEGVEELYSPIPWETTLVLNASENHMLVAHARGCGSSTANRIYEIQLARATGSLIENSPFKTSKGKLVIWSILEVEGSFSIPPRILTVPNKRIMVVSGDPNVVLDVESGYVKILGKDKVFFTVKLDVGNPRAHWLQPFYIACSPLGVEDEVASNLIMLETPEHAILMASSGPIYVCNNHGRVEVSCKHPVVVRVSRRIEYAILKKWYEENHVDNLPRRAKKTPLIKIRDPRLTLFHAKWDITNREFIFEATISNPTPNDVASEIYVLPPAYVKGAWILGSAGEKAVELYQSEQNNVRLLVPKWCTLQLKMRIKQRRILSNTFR